MNKSKKARKVATEASTTLKEATVLTTDAAAVKTLDDVSASLENMHVDSESGSSSETANDPDVQI